MAIYLTGTRTLILEPAKCGTTWIQHAIRATGIETAKSQTIGDCCPRHSFATDYAGEFEHIISPVRHPRSWLLSYFDYHKKQIPMVWQPNRKYPHKVFGSSMPEHFEDFVYHCLNGCYAQWYLRSFTQAADVVIHQENLRHELGAALLDLGYEPERVEKIRNVPRMNTCERSSSWSDVPEYLRDEFDRQCEKLVAKHYPETDIVDVCES